MNGERETILLALFALSEKVRLDGQQFTTRARKVQTFDQIGGDNMPALLQGEYDETFSQVTRLPYKRTLSAAWIMYHKPPEEGGASANNALMDSVERAFAPDDPTGGFTLGGLVYHAHIDGQVFKDPGDLDGQAMVVVPIKLLLP